MNTFLASSNFSCMLRIEDKVQYCYALCDKLEKGEQLLASLASLDPSSPVPESVYLYLEETVGTESLMNVSVGSGASLTKVMDWIKSVLTWLWNTATDLFKLVFNQYYRAQRKFIQHNQTILSILDPDRRARIEAAKATVGTQENVAALMKQVISLNKEIQSASAVSVADHLDRFVVIAINDLGCKYVDGKLIDNLPFSKEIGNGTMISLGWSYDNIKDIISASLTASYEMTNSSIIETNTLSAVKSLERHVNGLLRKNADVNVIQTAQERVAERRRIQLFITSSLAVALVRYTWIASQIDSIMNVVTRTK